MIYYDFFIQESAFGEFEVYGSEDDWENGADPLFEAEDSDSAIEWIDEFVSLHSEDEE